MADNAHHDFMHPNSGESNFNESMYFNFYDRAAKLGGFARLGNRANEGYAEMTLVVYQPDGTVLFNYLRPAIADNSAFNAGGMTFEVVEPVNHLRVSYAGDTVYLADPLALEDPKQAFTTNPHRSVQLQLDYYGLSPMYGGEADISGSGMVFAKGHTEQHVKAVGRISIDGKETALNALGLRDHSWGPRSWQSPKFYRWLTCQFDERFGFMGSQIALQNGIELLTGFVFKDGVNHYVYNWEFHTDWAGEGHYHDRISAKFHTPVGDFDITGRVLSMLPLRNRKEGKVTRISEGMTEWRCGDHIGYGLSEYLDQAV
jgi:hypothetical protein